MCGGWGVVGGVGGGGGGARVGGGIILDKTIELTWLYDTHLR